MRVPIKNRVNVNFVCNQHMHKAVKIVSATAGTLVNKEKSVRKQALKAMEVIIRNVEVYVGLSI